MSITSMLFIFVFLPISLAIYYISNDEVKEYILLAVSLVFYALASLRYVMVFVIAIAISVVIGRAIEASDKMLYKRMLLVAGIIENLGLLIYYKYTGGMSMPLGLSFFTFKSLSYLIDVYRNRITMHDNPIHDALYLSFFGQIQSGPLTRYSDMQRIKCDKEKGDVFSGVFADGVYRFTIGFNKKILLANVLSHITTEIFTNSFEHFSSAYGWLGSICYSLQLFFDFSGYSDMAIGISMMFGYKCCENFDYPYITDSVSHFWRRWHISLGKWFRDYVYIPLGGSKNVSRSRLFLNLFAVWFLTGVWHGSSWNFIVWGLGYFLVIYLEHVTGLPNKLKSKPASLIYRICALIFINCQWVLFRSENMINGLRFIKRMFVFRKDTLADTRTLFLLRDYWLFITCAVLLSMPIIPIIHNRIKSFNPVLRRLTETVYALAVVGLFVWAISFVVSGQNNPFAYANF